MRDIGEVWGRIKAHEGQVFKLVRGEPLTYRVDDNVLVTSRSRQELRIGDFEKVLAIVPVKGPGEINQMVRGPSYIYAILDDPRICRGDW